ncbi:MAG: hypothetical protein AAFZ09_05030, partial [Pseudomonadota bacterium]
MSDLPNWGLRHVRLFGPVGSAGPLWELECAVLHAGMNSGPLVVDRSHGLRVLSRSERNAVGPIEAPGKTFHEPLLMAASVQIGARDGLSGAHRLIHGPAGGIGGRHRPKGLVIDADLETEPGRVREVIVAPEGPWPAREDEIQVPRLRLVAGRLPIRILDDSQGTGRFTTFLGHRPATDALFHHLGIRRRGERLGAYRGFNAWLTAEGIEFVLAVPNPVSDLATGQPAALWATTRLEPVPGADRRYRLRLVDRAPADEIPAGQPPANSDWAAARLGLGAAFATLRDANLPLRVDFRTGSGVPGLSYRL